MKIENAGKSKTASRGLRRRRDSTADAAKVDGAAGTGSTFNARRAALVTRITALFLARGLAEVPLRELARELDTSDRMLLYYFKDKTELVTAALSELAAGLRQALQSALASGRIAPAELLKQITTVLGSRPIKPYMNVWADLVAHGTRGEEPYRTFVSASAAGWLERIEARLDLPAGAGRRRVAAVILTIAEGSRMLEDAVPGCTRDTLQIFAAGLEAAGSASKA
jgi:AcrR family transcriptional regulator